MKQLENQSQNILDTIRAFLFHLQWTSIYFSFFPGVFMDLGLYVPGKGEGRNGEGSLKLSLALAHNSKVAWFLNDLKTGALETTCILYIHLPLILWKQASPISTENLLDCVSFLPVLTLSWYSSKASWSWSAEPTSYPSLIFFIPFCLKCVS